MSESTAHEMTPQERAKAGIERDNKAASVTAHAHDNPIVVVSLHEQIAPFDYTSLQPLEPKVISILRDPSGSGHRPVHIVGHQGEIESHPVQDTPVEEAI